MDMYMDTEMEMGMGEELFYDQFLGVEDGFVFDFDYEFDAPRYFDFTNPEDDLEEQEEAELWFGTAPTYTPSPHVIRWKLRIDKLLQEENPSSFVQESENMNPNMNIASTMDDKSKGSSLRNTESLTLSKGLIFMYIGAKTSARLGSQGYETTQDVTKAKPKSALQRCASFMNPTVSHLAKQNDHPNVQCDRLLRRLKKLTIKDKKQISRSSFNGSVLTKRQKLEAGYVGKFSRLKHQASFPHKSSKKIGQLDDANALLGRPKTTIPKEPNLETANRATEGRRSKNVLGLAENAKSNANNFKARPLNKNILRSPSLNLQERRNPRHPQFQEFHLRTMERAKHHARINAENATENEITDSKLGKGENAVATLREKPEAKSRPSSCLSKQEPSSATSEKFSAEPPVEKSFDKLFSEDVHSDAKPQSEISHSID